MTFEAIATATPNSTGMIRSLGNKSIVSARPGMMAGGRKLMKSVNDPEYRAKLLNDLRQRKVAPTVEAMLWHSAYGVSKQTVAVEATPGSIFAISCLPPLSPDPSLRAAPHE